MAQYRKKILKMPQNLIDGTWSVNEFEKNYFPYFIDEIPNGDLSNEDLDFFGTIQDKLDFTALNPNTESRRYGWISRDEYMIFVKKINMINY